MEEMSFQVSLENWQRSSIPDGDGKIIPPARNGEWKRSGKWFCASLWWHHEASLTSRSQTYWGDADCYKWVEVGGCWACGCYICKHQCLELDAGCNWETVQEDREVWHGHWGHWRPVVLLHSESSVITPSIKPDTPNVFSVAIKSDGSLCFYITLHLHLCI